MTAAVFVEANDGAMDVHVVIVVWTPPRLDPSGIPRAKIMNQSNLRRVVQLRIPENTLY